MVLEAADFVWITEEEAKKFISLKSSKMNKDSTLEDVVIKLAGWQPKTKTDKDRVAILIGSSGPTLACTYKPSETSDQKVV